MCDVVVLRAEAYLKTTYSNITHAISLSYTIFLRISCVDLSCIADYTREMNVVALSFTLSSFLSRSLFVHCSTITPDGYTISAQ